MGLDEDATALVITSVTGLIVFTILWLVFEVVRNKKKNIFLYRKHVAENRPDVRTYKDAPIGYPEPPSASKLGWLSATLRLGDQELIDTVGLDGTMFLSFERMVLRIFVVAGVVSGAVLIPTYATGPNFGTGVLAQISMANRNPGDQLLWIAFIVDIVIVWVTIFLIFHESKRYMRYRRAYRAADNPANYTIVVYDIPEESWSDEAIKAQFEKVYPGQVVAAHRIFKDVPVQKKLVQRLAAIEKRERAEYNCVHNLGERPMHKVGCCAACKGTAPVDSIDYWQAEQDRLTKEVVSDQLEMDPKVFGHTRNAFVVFNSKLAATSAVQSQVFGGPMHWRIQRAGEPKAIHWKGLGVSSIGAGIFKANSIFWLFFFLAFWPVVTAAVMSVANLGALFDLIAEQAPSTAGFFEDLNYEGWPTFVRSILEKILPVVILIVLNLLPKIIIKLMVTFERLPSLHQVEIKQRNLLYVFTLFGAFIYVLLSGSILEQIDQIANNPGSIVGLLADSVPKQAIFFLNFIAGLCFIGFGIELSQIVRIILHWILGFIWKTDRQKRKIDGMGSVFLYGAHYVPTLLIATIGLVYSTIAPLVTLFAMLYFVIGYVTHKHNIAWTMVNPWHGGGQAFAGTLQCILIALYLKTIAMIGIFGFYELVGPPIVEIINLAGIAAFNIWLWRRYSRLFNEGALVDKLQESDGGKNNSAEDYHGLYINKGLQELKEEPNLAGVNIKDATKIAEVMAEEGNAPSLARDQSGQYLDGEAESGVPVHLQSKTE
eukprot:CAMPEP_0198316974 /NCGR_PEP_ID=MMETSP1450-20131203/6648_1 /TAXON_ID=753684 ORGANISM="Madagascaria erythrocladiodes, Strain CCMP3234" /NCGR_SAMPLE_ID=MMETSP1450 /ASSEMBLY_ACC=CAM_ASM_001115 /LENGTH=768 /DNA_ID=CAMNT_0044020155 /DNA_START=137 /DNA_END=2443 /DNA_ORIENTATION=-